MQLNIHKGEIITKNAIKKGEEKVLKSEGCVRGANNINTCEEV
jgi:hypothetical protein